MKDLTQKTDNKKQTNANTDLVRSRPASVYEPYLAGASTDRLISIVGDGGQMSPMYAGLRQQAVVSLQRTIGNRAVQRLIKSGTLQAKLKIGRPGDRYEQEADRVASYLANETLFTQKLSARERSANLIQRQEQKKPPTEEEKYKEAAKKIGEAFLETPAGKRITDKAKELGEDFVSTLPGKVITGTVAAGVVAAIIAKNVELPIQLPIIPMDKVATGLSMKITYKGPVRNPTGASIAFTYKFGVEKKGGKKQTKTKHERFREETARMAHEQYKFRESLKTPEQKAADEAFMRWYIVKQTQDPTSPLYIPGLVPKKEATKLEEKK